MKSIMFFLNMFFNKVIWYMYMIFNTYIVNL